MNADELRTLEPGSLLLVHWDDATYHGGWHSHAHVESHTSCTSVGYLVEVSTGSAPMLTIAQGVGVSSGVDGDLLNSTGILVSMISRVEHLEVASGTSASDRGHALPGDASRIH